MTDRNEAVELRLGPSQAYRSNLVAKLALVDTVGSLRIQLGPEVLDEQDYVIEASTRRLEQLRQEHAANALQATLGMPAAHIPRSAENPPVVQEGAAFRPLPGFSTEVPITGIEQMRRSDLDLAA